MMYTFDNTFQISFLFRDGCIAFVKDDEGLPAIKPIDETTKLQKPTEMTSFTSSLSNDLIQVAYNVNFKSIQMIESSLKPFIYCHFHFLEIHQKVQNP